MSLRTLRRGDAPPTDLVRLDLPTRRQPQSIHQEAAFVPPAFNAAFAPPTPPSFTEQQLLAATGPKQHVIITPHMQEIVNDQIHALLPGAFHKVGLTYRGLTRRHTWACTVEEQQANVKGIVTVLGCSYQMMRF